jgi:hypothetical protein
MMTIKPPEEAREWLEKVLREVLKNTLGSGLKTEDPWQRLKFAKGGKGVFCG